MERIHRPKFEGRSVDMVVDADGGAVSIRVEGLPLNRSADQAGIDLVDTLRGARWLVRWIENGEAGPPTAAKAAEFSRSLRRVL